MTPAELAKLEARIVRANRSKTVRAIMVPVKDLSWLISRSREGVA